MTTRAIVIGGGIAGPLTAIGLQRAGIEASVYEAYPRNASLAAGSWLTLAVNGLRALRELGVHREVMAQGFPSSTIEFAAGGGKSLGTVPIGGSLSDGTQTHTVKRCDLYRALHQAALAHGVRIEHDKRLVAAETGDGQVHARFADGSGASADLLIGADGIHSKVRKLIDAGAPEPRYTGLGNVGGFVRDASLPVSPGVYRMIFGRRAFFGYTVSPSGEVWWFANPPSARPLPREQASEPGGDGCKQRLLALFAGDAGPACKIIAATPGPLLCTNQYEMPRVPQWRRDRMLIIGDAAHAASASSGQGASMAAEDALCLALCLRDVPQVPAALAAFETLRRARVERVVAEGARRSSEKTVGPVGRVIRDLVMPVVLKRVASQAKNNPYDWLYRYELDWAAPLPLGA